MALGTASEGVGRGMRELASGVDALYLSARAALPENLLAQSFSPELTALQRQVLELLEVPADRYR